MASARPIRKNARKIGSVFSRIGEPLRSWGTIPLPATSWPRKLWSFSCLESTRTTRRMRLDHAASPDVQRPLWGGQPVESRDRRHAVVEDSPGQTTPGRSIRLRDCQRAHRGQDRRVRIWQTTGCTRVLTAIGRTRRQGLSCLDAMRARKETEWNAFTFPRD